VPEEKRAKKLQNVVFIVSLPDKKFAFSANSSYTNGAAQQRIPAGVGRAELSRRPKFAKEE
jgi:hypothetical protein